MASQLQDKTQRSICLAGVKLCGLDINEVDSVVVRLARFKLFYIGHTVIREDKPHDPPELLFVQAHVEGRKMRRSGRSSRHCTCRCSSHLRFVACENPSCLVDGYCGTKGLACEAIGVRLGLSYTKSGMAGRSPLKPNYSNIEGCEGG